MVHSDADTRQWIAAVLPLSAALFVAERDGRVAAMMALSPGWLEHLYVHPQFHGSGIGSALLAVAKASAEACNGLSLWTFQGNAGARRFYERHGFEAAELTDGTGNEEKTPDVRYVWHG